MATVILNSQIEIPILNVLPAKLARNSSILANLIKKNTVGIYHVLWYWLLDNKCLLTTSCQQQLA